MRIALIGCMVMNREISHLVSRSRNIVRTWWLRQGLHDTPEVLRGELQRTLDEVEAENGRLRAELRYEAVALGYGLCSNGVIGLKSRTLPVVVPRCDDCISLFLGSAERYRALFGEMPGTYWYNAGWIEQAFTPSRANYQLQRAEYVRQYGEEEADYLMEVTNNWMTSYRRCGYITSPLGERAEHEAYARRAAADFGWTFEKVEGDLGYLEALVDGPWDEGRFLLCPPGCEIRPDYSARKLAAVPAGEGG